MIDSLELEICSKIFLSVLPHRGSSFGEQLEECIKALEEKALAAGFDPTNVLMQTFFIRTKDKNDYSQKKTEGTSILTKFYKSNFPATSFVAQYPDQEKEVSLDAILLSNSNKGKIHHRNCEGIQYTVVESPQITEVYAAGLTNQPNQLDIRIQSREAFDSMKRVLKSEDMDFSHIVRQWNYLENFLKISSGQGEARQNYQIFNDFRAAFYGEVEFPEGYPASTGIGMFTGGVVLECIALKPAPDILIASLSNPLQKDAHKYSQDVLVGCSGRDFEKKASPLFERAKIVIQGNSGIVFVSGTAAVRGQNTISEKDIQNQTVATIENIDTLISKENLLSIGVDIGSSSPQLSQLRAYVKKDRDLPLVKKICEDHYGNVPSQYVISDICRDALLVEIEGTVYVPIHGIIDRKGG
jgi:enamine deaminase RidA (YjgF/YER057c/UK114 family)